MHKLHFASFEAFLDQVQKPGHPGNLRNATDRDQHRFDRGTGTYDEAIRLARNGWPDGLARMKDITGHLAHCRGDQTDTLVMHYAESGDDADVSRFVEGDPESMLEYKPQAVPVTGRVIKMLVQVNGRAKITADQMFRRGAAALRIADLIERVGLRLEIWIVSTKTLEGDINDTYSEFTVIVKRPEQPLELDRLAFMLANVAVHRRFIARLCEQCPPPMFKSHYGTYYGCSCDMQNVDPDCIYIGNIAIGTDAQCEQFIQQTISKYVEQPA